MPAGTVVAQRAARRWLVMPAMLVLLVGGLDAVVPAPQAAAYAARMSGSPGSPAWPGNRVTAYVANAGSDTVTPIATASNTAGPPITTGYNPFAIAITPDGKTAYAVNDGSGGR